MQLTVVGAGNIGGTIGRAWLAAGHEVLFRVEDPAKHAGRFGDARVQASSEAPERAEATLLAVPGRAVRSALEGMAPVLAGAVVIDASNNVGGGGSLNAAADVAELAPGALYYRAFNSMGWENFASPRFSGGQQADLFYAGPDGASRDLVESLVGDVGLRPVWVGGAEHTETVDGVARLWFALVLGRHLPRHTAFRMLSD